MSERPATAPAPPANAELAPVYRAAIVVLTWGFRIGAAILTVGLLVALAKREDLNREVDPFSEVVPKILEGEAAGIIDLAILTLMATPLATVLVVATGFYRAGDRRYGALSLLVLAVLCVSVALTLLR